MANAPCFFKIILEDVIQEGKLGIPNKFVRRYGNYLQGQAFLKVPGGAKWQVELVKSGHGIWFGNGWQHFVDYYSISLGSFLVLGFEDFRSCTFNVLIFDKTASEIEYPFNVHEDVEEPNLEKQFHQPINEEYIDVDALQPPVSRPCRKRKQENCRTQSDAKRGNPDRVLKRDKANALQRASTFCKPDIPSFSIVMHPSYISTKKSVTIPASFANKYITNEQGVLTWNSADGKTCSVGYNSYIVYKTSRVTIISNGWGKFVEDNHLAIGDVCVFEPTNHNASEFKVLISRANHDAANSVPSTAYTDGVYGGI